jgi:hypothetical protein
MCCYLLDTYCLVIAMCLCVIDFMCMAGAPFKDQTHFSWTLSTVTSLDSPTPPRIKAAQASPSGATREHTYPLGSLLGGDVSLRNGIVAMEAVTSDMGYENLSICPSEVLQWRTGVGCANVLSGWRLLVRKRLLSHAALPCGRGAQPVCR